MNRIVGIIHWNCPAQALNMIDGNQVASGNLELSIHRIPVFQTNSPNFYYDRESWLLCGIIGYISNLSELKTKYKISTQTDTAIVAKLYRVTQLEFIPELDGVFTVFLFDMKKQIAYLFQDEYACNLPIYYTSIGHQFLFSTQLKQILLHVPVQHRQLDSQAIYNFLYHKKIIPNKDTLIKNIFKLLPQKCLRFNFNNQTFEILSIPGDVRKVSQAQAKKKLLPVIAESVTSLLDPLVEKNIAMTLSAGFDTNLLLYLLRKKTTENLRAITIGGVERNEISAARQIVTNYESVEHITKIIDPSLIDAFPDIVWRTEGYVYNDGLFLQYMLAQILHSGQSRQTFLGECADQQLDFFRHSKLYKAKVSLRKLCKRTFLGHWYYASIKHKLPANPQMEAFVYHFKKYAKNVYPHQDIDYDFILKKSGLMLNSFGIQGIYPFLNRNVKTMSRSLGRLNSQKRFYKMEVRKLIGEKNGKLISKNDGRTDIEYLLNSRLKPVMQIFDSELMRQLFLPSMIRKITTCPQFYSSLIMQLLMIFLFNELFITGKYDRYFNANTITLSLADLLEPVFP